MIGATVASMGLSATKEDLKILGFVILILLIIIIGLYIYGGIR